MTRESDIENYLVKMAKSYGGEVRKVKWIGREGAPDRLVMLPLCEQPVWVEVKTPGGKAAFPKNAHERKQAREHARLRAMGQRVEIVDSYDGVDELLERR
jgi:hypothetical protein